MNLGDPFLIDLFRTTIALFVIVDPLGLFPWFWTYRACNFLSFKI